MKIYTSMIKGVIRKSILLSILHGASRNQKIAETAMSFWKIVNWRKGRTTGDVSANLEIGALEITNGLN